MNRSPNDTDDWSDIGQAWRDQVAAPIDVERLRAAVTRHSRRLRIGRVLDVVAGTVATAMCLRMLLRSASDPIAQLGYIVLIVVVVVSISWPHWLRRGQWHALSNAPAVLVDFEMGRIRTSLRIWRGSAWTATVLWIGLWLATYVAPHLRELDATASDKSPGLWISAIVMLIGALLTWWLARRARDRLRQLERLRQALQAPN